MATPPFGLSSGRGGGAVGACTASGSRAPAVAAGMVGNAAATAPWRAGCLTSSQPTTTRFMSSNVPSPTAQMPNRLLGGATFTSNNAGPFLRWRSLSDFFSASSMKDMGQPP